MSASTPWPPLNISKYAFARLEHQTVID